MSKIYSIQQLALATGVSTSAIRQAGNFYGDPTSDEGRARKLLIEACEDRLGIDIHKPATWKGVIAAQLMHDVFQI